MCSAVAFSDSHKLTLKQARLCAVDSNRQINVLSISHLERRFRASRSEHVVVRSEVENSHSVSGTFCVHDEVERLHPCANRANSHVQFVDNFLFTIHVLHMEHVNVTGTTTIGESGLGDEVTLSGTNVLRASAVRASNSGTIDRLSVEVDVLVRNIGQVLTANEEVAAIVGKWRVESDDASATISFGNKCQRSCVHHLAVSLGLKSGDRCVTDLFEVNVNRRFGCVRNVNTCGVEFDTVNSATIHESQVSRRDDKLASREVIEVIDIRWHVVISRSTIVHRYFTRSCHANEGQHKRHHQRKYFLFHNELIW